MEVCQFLSFSRLFWEMYAFIWSRCRDTQAMWVKRAGKSIHLLIRSWLRWAGGKAGESRWVYSQGLLQAGKTSRRKVPGKSSGQMPKSSQLAVFIATMLWTPPDVWASHLISKAEPSRPTKGAYFRCFNSWAYMFIHYQQLVSADYWVSQVWHTIFSSLANPFIKQTEAIWMIIKSTNLIVAVWKSVELLV